MNAVAPHEIFMLRNAKIETRDALLAKKYPKLYDKFYISEQINNDKPLILNPGSFFLKPQVSTEGCGFGAQKIENKHKSILIQEYRGEYLNVDWCEPLKKAYIYTAARNGLRFKWFKYEGCSEYVHRKIEDIKLLAPSEPIINVEFIGDKVLEAHARPSTQFINLVAAAGDEDLLHYFYESYAYSGPTVDKAKYNLYSVLAWLNFNNLNSMDLEDLRSRIEKIWPQIVIIDLINFLESEKDEDWEENSIESHKRAMAVNCAFPKNFDIKLFHSWLEGALLCL